MNNHTLSAIFFSYMGVWLFLFMAAQFKLFPKHLIFLQQYWWLYLPFVSWLFTVFPLILPPLPLGPVSLSLARSRRRMFSFYKEGAEYLRKEEKEHDFPWGYFLNVMINLWDIATLGLSQLFATASLLQELILKYGTVEEQTEINPVSFCYKWLLLGNVLFIAAYIACPGVIFAPLLVRMEKYLSAHRIAVSNI